MRVVIESTPFDGVAVLQPHAHFDERGWFMESYRIDHFAELGLTEPFVQDNHSRSSKGVLRGLHFQWDPPMGKLMRVTVGRAFVVAVDIRYDSPTLGRWYGREATADNRLQVWAPAGFARGFCALSEIVEVQYKCTGTYNAPCESGIRWDDPQVGIDWPIDGPLLSDKDANAQTLAQWLGRPESRAFRFRPSADSRTRGR
ncbi:MAG TPA: dTDP-4-dehydrorhamnose 3,5-epimerase [Candidatus Polarisedimenticolaceae bacterium]|nr:dTDP-4-dehydrorhamnose 3,5-epimerase [Candidatus Polarisedimenticolaceae bacterium]